LLGFIPGETGLMSMRYLRLCRTKPEFELYGSEYLKTFIPLLRMR
jgi:hypothetical protein